MKVTIRILGVSFLLAFIFLGITSHEAKATFIVDPDPGGEKFFIDKPDDPTTSFWGDVGGQNSGVKVHVVTNVDVTTGSGYANIKPDGDLILTTLTFTPDDPNLFLFRDFSFRGQLDEEGTVTVKVWDNQGDPYQSFTFDIANANQDFGRIGIISIDEETIKSVVIESNGFKEVKQIDFSYTPIPEPVTLLLLGSGLIGLAGYGRKKFLKK